jgi:hypothetical protein
MIVCISKIDSPARSKFYFDLGFLLKLGKFLELKLNEIRLCSPLMQMSGAAGILGTYYPALDVRIPPQLVESSTSDKSRLRSCNISC